MNHPSTSHRPSDSRLDAALRQVATPEPPPDFAEGVVARVATAERSRVAPAAPRPAWRRWTPVALLAGLLGATAASWAAPLVARFADVPAHPVGPALLAAGLVILLAGAPPRRVVG